jgi:putative nucleotidyltransferase with HDIG domain
MDDPRGSQNADEFLRRLVAALRATQLYSAGHPIITRNVEGLFATLNQLLATQPTITMGLVGDEIVVGDWPTGKVDQLGDTARRLKRSGVERITFDRGVTRAEVELLLSALATLEAGDAGELPEFPSMPHVRLGRVQIERQVATDMKDMATIRHLYQDAVAAANNVWDAALTEGRPDATIARNMVDGLAQAIAQNRTALLALTALKEYDNYTFTHMVNVSILTMGQARGLGVDGSLLREFGLSALMHDIGKVRTPTEILNKPDKLTDDEFTTMRQHVVHGAEILHRTPDMPALAPVVAFEHHLRLDGTGYPFGVNRGSLNLGTMLCGIADVYDAMRSQRAYQQAFPTDRILQVLKRNDGTQFDQHLVRRFTQLLGIYPVGNLVRLNTGEVAVVVKAYAPDPYRPQVRIVLDRNNWAISRPVEVNLWEADAESGQPSSVAAPVDPAEYGIDPLTLL